MDKATKYKEDQLRRVAKRQGLMLVKSRTRDPRAIDYGCYALTDLNRHIVFGIGAAERFAASLEEISEYLDQNATAAERERRQTEDLLRYQAQLRNMYLVANRALPGQHAGAAGYSLMRGGAVAFAGDLEAIQEYLDQQHTA